MRRSAERVLTTHTGSLPRPPGLSVTGPEREPGQLAEAVRFVVGSQVSAGVDVVNDGEASKPSYATYVTERLPGPGHGLEHRRDRRRYAQLVGRENVLAGTDCGFATFATSSTVDPQVAWAKLAAMAEGARLASQQLWP
jgi:methionine synthase II (cobalamin-independent)